MLLADTGVAGPADEAGQDRERALECLVRHVPGPPGKGTQESLHTRIEPADPMIAAPTAHPGAEPEAALHVRGRHAGVAFAAREGA